MSAETQPIDAPRPPPGPMTYEEFLDWCDEDTLAEWVDGEVVRRRNHESLLPPSVGAT